MNKNVPSMKTQMAKRMVAAGKYNKQPLWDRSTHAKKIAMPMAKKGPYGKDMTMRKDKHFTKESSNGKVQKGGGNWEMDD